MEELDTVVLTHDLAISSLKKGDVGAIVHAYPGGRKFEVEFVTGEGRTAAVVTLDAADIRPMRPREILHAREITSV